MEQLFDLDNLLVKPDARIPRSNLDLLADHFGNPVFHLICVIRSFRFNVLTKFSLKSFLDLFARFILFLDDCLYILVPLYAKERVLIGDLPLDVFNVPPARQHVQVDYTLSLNDIVVVRMVELFQFV